MFTCPSGVSRYLKQEICDFPLLLLFSRIVLFYTESRTGLLVDDHLPQTVWVRGKWREREEELTCKHSFQKSTLKIYQEEGRGFSCTVQVLASHHQLVTMEQTSLLLCEYNLALNCSKKTCEKL